MWAWGAGRRCRAPPGRRFTHFVVEQSVDTCEENHQYRPGDRNNATVRIFPHRGDPPLRVRGDSAQGPLRARYRTVHRHLRGENRDDPWFDHVNLGSPPRGWGELCRRRPGNAAISGHPHARGENTNETPIPKAACFENLVLVSRFVRQFWHY